MSKPGFITIADINKRFDLKLTTGFIIDNLGVPADDQDKRSVLWRDAKWSTICKQFSVYVRDCVEDTSKAGKTTPPADDDEL